MSARVIQGVILFSLQLNLDYLKELKEINIKADNFAITVTTIAIISPY